MAYLDTEGTINGIVAALKAQLPAKIASIDPTLEIPRDGTGGKEDSYYFGDCATLPIVFPALSVRTRTEDVVNPDRSGSYPLLKVAVEIELVCGGGFTEQAVNRNCYRYARAVKEVIEGDNTLGGLLPDCQFIAVSYSNLWKGAGGASLYKAFLMEVEVRKT